MVLINTKLTTGVEEQSGVDILQHCVDISLLGGKEKTKILKQAFHI